MPVLGKVLISYYFCGVKGKVMKKILTFLLVALATGAVHAQVYPLRTIEQIQFVHPDTLLTGKTLSPLLNDTVRVRGLVIFNPRNHALSANWKASYLVDTTGLASNNWRGLLVRLPAIADSSATNFFNTFQPGNIVEGTGVVREFQDASPNSGETQVDLIPVSTSVVGFAAPPAPKVVQINQLMQFDPNDPAVPQKIQKTTGEQYEGMYIEIPNVFVTGVSTFGGGRVSWLVRDASGAEMNVRDASVFFRPPFVSSTASNPPNPFADVFVQQGKAFAYIRGVITETNFGTLYPRYEIVPLVPTDLGPVTAAPPFASNVALNPAIPSTNTNVTIGAKIEDLDGAVSSAKLYYTNGIAGTVYDSVTMTLAAVDSFIGVIPGSFLTQDGQYIKYFIRAIDNQGNVSVTPDTSLTYSVFRVLNSGITQLSQIQETPFASGRSIYDGAVVNMNVRGRIMSTLSTNDYNRIIFQDGRGMMSGIVLSPGNSGATDIDIRQRGDSIHITRGRIFEDFGITTIEVLNYSFINSGQPYAPIAVPMDSIIARRYNFTEVYESMLLEYNNVFVVNQNPDAPSNFGEFAIYPDSNATTGLRVRGGVAQSSPDLGQNFNTDSLRFRQQLTFIRGILTFNFSNWKIQPRNRSDIAGFATNTGNVSVPEILSNANLTRLYPNPNQGRFTIEMQATAFEQIQMDVLDMAGRVLHRQTFQVEPGNQNFDVNGLDLSNGMYIVKLSGSQTRQFARFQVNR